MELTAGHGGFPGLQFPASHPVSILCICSVTGADITAWMQKDEKSGYGEDAERVGCGKDALSIKASSVTGLYS